MENRTGITFLIVLGMVVCASICTAANGGSITFRKDGVIQDGNFYDSVFVYGNDTTVEIRGGDIGKLSSYDRSTVNISGGNITDAQSYNKSTINIRGGIVRVPKAKDAGSKINITGGTSWNIEVGSGQLDISGGTINGLGIFAAVEAKGAINIYGYGFDYRPIIGKDDERLTGFWEDGTPFSMDFRSDAYRLVTLHEIYLGFTPIADAGPDQTIVVGIKTVAAVTLDGSASRAPDSVIFKYEWSWTINSVTFKAEGVNPTILLPLGEHVIKLIVSNGRLESLPDYVVIDVLTPTQQIEKLRDEKLQLLEQIDLMLAQEQQVTSELNAILDSGEYGGLTRDGIIAATQAIDSVMQHQQQAKLELNSSIEQLQNALASLGIPVEP